jgi:hypothetical protein
MLQLIINPPISKLRAAAGGTYWFAAVCKAMHCGAVMTAIYQLAMGRCLHAALCSFTWAHASATSLLHGRRAELSKLCGRV